MEDYRTIADQLSERQEALVADSQSILARVHEQDRELNSEERATLASNTHEFEQLGERLKALDVVNAMHAGTGRKTEPEPIHARAPLDTAAMVPAAAAVRTVHQPGLDLRRFSALFPSEPITMGGFRDAAEYFRTALSGRYDARLIQASAWTEVGEQGGFHVPSSILASLLDTALEDELIRPRAQVVPMPTKAVTAPVFDTEDRADGVIGGFTGQWLPELGTINDQTGSVRTVNLVSDKLAIGTTISNELLVDGPTYQRALEPHMREAAGWHLDLAYLRGSGAGQPAGILTSNPAHISVAADSGQVADTITTSNVLAMWARLHPAAARSAIWIMHSTCFPQVAQMVIGTGSAVALLFRPGDGADGSIGTLLGRPVFQSEKASPVGDQGDLLLCAPRFYLIGMRSVMTLQTSIHAGWTNDSTKVRLIVRTTGLSAWSKAVVPYGGTATQSWAIVLDERA